MHHLSIRVVSCVCLLFLLCEVKRVLREDIKCARFQVFLRRINIVDTALELSRSV
jgi:hypothetical protein